MYYVLYRVEKRNTQYNEYSRVHTKRRKGLVNTRYGLEGTSKILICTYLRAGTTFTIHASNARFTLSGASSCTQCPVSNIWTVPFGHSWRRMSSDGFATQTWSRAHPAKNTGCSSFRLLCTAIGAGRGQ